MILPEERDNRHGKEGHLQEGEGVQLSDIGAGGFHRG
jgi:hypothetical protein